MVVVLVLGRAIRGEESVCVCVLVMVESRRLGEVVACAKVTRLVVRMTRRLLSLNGMRFILTAEMCFAKWL